MKLPKQIRVHIQKGESGALVASLDQYEAVTEGDNLTELFFNVNDLIYTIFEVPKKYQDNIQFIPTKDAQKEMIRIAQSSVKKVERQFEIRRFIRDNTSKNFAVS